VGQACGHRGLHVRTTLRESIAQRPQRTEIGGWWQRDVGDTFASGEGRNGRGVFIRILQLLNSCNS
jgi:hypothetical protein